tara:strand:+ start:965 stop:1240 length:276 start_codon:yes stop_codon:yes gene_type:complete
MKISTTYTVGGETFATEQEAMDYSHFLDRRTNIVDLFHEYHWIFDEKKAGVKNLSTYSSPFDEVATKKLLAAALINNPEVFKLALDIVEGK